MSWTLDKGQAESFATDYRPIDGYAGFLMERTVRKSSVLFYTNGREEQEIGLRVFTVGAARPVECDSLCIVSKQEPIQI